VAVYPDVTPLFRIVGSIFFAGAALVFLGGFWLMVYETIAIFTRQVPTISLVASFEFLKHPVWWVTLACMVAFAFGALVTHFTHWTP
jgi:hypothetical protein